MLFSQIRIKTVNQNRVLVILAWILLLGSLLEGAVRREISTQGKWGAVSTAHPLATQAALKMLRNGGNAVDGAVAAAFVLAVVEPSNSGLAGDGYALIHLPNGRLECWDASSPPPHAAPKFDHPIGFPSETALLLKLHERNGRLALPQVMAPAIDYARKGFTVTGYLETMIAKGLKRFHDPEVIRLFAPRGRPMRAGEMLIQTALSDTLQAIARDRGESFYRGELAERMVLDLQKRGSRYSTTDFSRYRVRPVVPLQVEVGGFRFVGSPPPSSSVVTIALAREWERRKWDLDSPADAEDHLRVLKSLFRLKSRKLASFLKEPQQFLALSDQELACGKSLPGGIETEKENSETDLPEDTTHLVVWDKQGLVVTMTLTLGSHWGTGDFSPLGFFYNGEGLLFRHSGHHFPDDYPDGFGPISAKSPLLVFNGKNPVLAIGGAGSNRIIANVGTICGSMLFGGKSLEQASHAPRRTVDRGKAVLEWGVSESVLQRIREKFDPVEVREGGNDYFGLVSAITASAGLLCAVGDYRRDGAAGVLNTDPDGVRHWSVDLVTWSRRRSGETGVTEIASSARQISHGWKGPDGSVSEYSASGPTVLARLKYDEPVPAFHFRQRVTIVPDREGTTSGEWESPLLWNQPPVLGPRSKAFLKKIPASLTQRRCIEWLMVEIGHGIPYKAMRGRMTGEKLLELGFGDCSGKARLLSDLARHRGIPCRLVGGLLLRSGLSATTHIWCEAWLENRWVPVCPTNQIFGRLPANWLVMRYGEATTLEKPGQLIFRVREHRKGEKERDTEECDLYKSGRSRKMETPGRASRMKKAAVAP